jgi:hypothetical protein
MAIAHASLTPSDAGVYKGRREYTLRLAEAGDGREYTVALLRQIERGNGEAQDAARDMIDDLEPRQLGFGKMPPFTISRLISDAELTAIDSVDSLPDELSSRLGTKNEVK